MKKSYGARRKTQQIMPCQSRSLLYIVLRDYATAMFSVFVWELRNKNVLSWKKSWVLYYLAGILCTFQQACRSIFPCQSITMPT